MIAASVVLITLVFNTAGRLSMLLPIGVLIASAILGAMDDRMSLLGSTRQGGMTARFKFLWLTVFALVAASILYAPFPYGLGLSGVYLPFIGRYEIGIFYIPVAALAIIAMANAVNFTDGLDTLAAGTAAIAFVAYAIIAYRQGQLGVVTFCLTMTGCADGLPLVQRPSGAGHHGRYRLAGDRRVAGGRGLHDRAVAALAGGGSASSSPRRRR